MDFHAQRALPGGTGLKAAIEGRDLISVVAGGIRLWGTYHPSSYASSFAKEHDTEQDRTGVLLLNPGFLPRASMGSTQVYWADSFARCGYPSFRFDLPGLGDSEGCVPEPMLDFVNCGAYAPAVATIVDELVGRFGLAGVVVVGLCAGAVTALYGCATSEHCRGVVLMDPYFHHLSFDAKGPRIRDELSKWASRSKLGGFLSSIYDRLRHLALLIPGNRPPRNANFPLLNCWKQLAQAGIPILLLKAPGHKTRGIKPRVGEFDYLDYLQGLSTPRSRLVVKFIEGTNHSFADSVGREAVRELIEQWLDCYFPLVQPQEVMDHRRVRGMTPY